MTDRTPSTTPAPAERVAGDPDGSDGLRILVAARHPFRRDDLGAGPSYSATDIRLVRRLRDLGDAMAEHDPDVVLVDTGFPDGSSMEAISTVRRTSEHTQVLALTDDPPPSDDVALAMAAGAAGYVDVGADPREFALAIEAVHRGDLWLPTDETAVVLRSLATELETTSKERRSKLAGIAFGLVPLAGAIAAMLSLFYRRYLGQISVRPVDLALDPASRVIDTIATFLLILGVFGPLLFVPTWVSQLQRSRLSRGLLAPLLSRRRLSLFLLYLVVLLIGAALAMGPDLIPTLFIGPLVGLALLARAMNLTDELPPVLQIEHARPWRVVAASIVLVLLFVAAVGYEAVIVGPRFDTSGVQGVIAPKVLGFSARPMRVLDVDSGTEDELLYLGGNADLYVLVDPCDNDEIYYVSVGATRLNVIDEVSC